MADANFTLPSNFVDKISLIDCISQQNTKTICALARSIARLTQDAEIVSLAKHIDYLAEDSMFEINGTAEELGANYKGPLHG